MAEELKEESTVGVDGLQNLQDDHTPGDFADTPKDAEGRRVEEEPAPALRTENVTAVDPNPDQNATDPHPEIEDPEQYIGDELPDPWEKDAVGSWNPIEEDQKRFDADADADYFEEDKEQDA